LELARTVKEAIADRALLVVNERVDVALAAGASGVQLGEEALPAAIARDILVPDSLIGRSVHSVAGADEAVAKGLTFWLWVRCIQPAPIQGPHQRVPS